MKYKNLVFDFDGVLAESNEIRFEGFRLLFKEYPKGQVDLLIDYAKANGGVSRYEKIRYFFEEILGETVTTEKIQSLAKRFSGLVCQKIIDAKPVKGSVEFLTQNASKFNFALVSGSDQIELRSVCCAREIDHFFKEILGSPVTKKENLNQLLKTFAWKPKDTVYIGDSKNDLEAAGANLMDFIGRDSGLVEWNRIGVSSIRDISELKNMLVRR